MGRLKQGGTMRHREGAQGLVGEGVLASAASSLGTGKDAGTDFVELSRGSGAGPGGKTSGPRTPHPDTRSTVKTEVVKVLEPKRRGITAFRSP